eukprot:3825166-Pleurochrysis_carterae.AAC.2
MTAGIDELDVLGSPILKRLPVKEQQVWRGARSLKRGQHNCAALTAPAIACTRPSRTLPVVDARKPRYGKVALKEVFSESDKPSIGFTWATLKGSVSSRKHELRSQMDPIAHGFTTLKLQLF